MTTKHLQIATAIVDMLKADAVAAGRVYGARTRAISAEQPNGVVVRLERSMSHLASVQGGPTGWTTLIAIECYGRAVGGAPDAVADEIVESVFDSMAAGPTLGGLAQDIEPLEGDTLSWDFDELDSNLACITAKFVVRHQTTGRTLT
ncbi:MAG: hypothetical protein WA191_20780 [Telluria sp.]